jgi:hypothetical protein
LLFEFQTWFELPFEFSSILKFLASVGVLIMHFLDPFH